MAKKRRKGQLGKITMKKVQGRDHLIKTDTGAVINADQNAYKLAKRHKMRILQERERQQSLERRIRRLEQLISELTGEEKLVGEEGE